MEGDSQRNFRPGRTPFRQGREGPASHAEREEVDANLRRLADEPASAISPVSFWALMALLNVAGISMLVSAWLSSTPVFHILLLTGSCTILSSAFVVRWKVLEERRRRVRIHTEEEALNTKKTNVTSEIGETEKERRALLHKSMTRDRIFREFHAMCWAIRMLE